MSSFKMSSGKQSSVREPAIEVKTSLMAVRGLRTAFLLLACNVAHEDKCGYLLLVDPKLSELRIDEEVKKIKSALHPKFKNRLFVIKAKNGQLEDGKIDISHQTLEALRRAVAETRGGNKLPSSSKQNEVVQVMIHQWFTGQAPMTSRWLAETVGCNYRTVASALGILGPAVQWQTDRRVSLKYIPEQEWSRLQATFPKTRNTMLYVDASGQPRSPEALLRRLSRMNRSDVAVGGVLGAKCYDDALDIVGTPRLDLCVHCPSNTFDLGFVQKLDPGLVPTRNAQQPARLALHFIRREVPLFRKSDFGFLCADPVECLLELYHARLDGLAKSFHEFLAKRGREWSEHV